jgi:hypothetical protein
MPVGQLSHGVMRWRWWAGGGAARRVASGGGVGLEVAWHGGQRRAEAAAPGGGGGAGRRQRDPVELAPGIGARGDERRQRRPTTAVQWRIQRQLHAVASSGGARAMKVALGKKEKCGMQGHCGARRGGN